MTGRGLATTPDQVLITSGSQQVLDLFGKLLLEADALVVVEEPTYIGALQAWRPYSPRFITLPMDSEGLDIGALERLLESGAQPRFLYLVSCFQNPTGITLSPARKRALVALAAQHHLPIVEDDPYSELYYNDVRPPSLAALDVEMHGTLSHVAYVSTFSKLLAPGLRIGWVVAPGELGDKLIQAKQGVDLHTGSLAQATAYEACRDGLLERHTPTIRATYRLRRDAMLAALERHMPAEVLWTRPEGGMFTWLTLPGHIDTTMLLQVALEQQVAFVPGTQFHANGGGTNTLRLNFSHSTPERIDEGVARLARSIAELL
jgi:2-aminoadipate transaminase